jgi:hypothetical protein
MTATSPAINASIGYETVLFDAEGQSRMGIRDIGADEFNSENEITNGPISELHAGPTAPETFSYEINTSTAVSYLTDNLIRVAPNPFVGLTRISMPAADNFETIVRIYNSQGQKISTVQISDSCFDLNTNEKGILFCIIQQKDKMYNIKLISK